jgi:oligopeptide transport system substrate-binding protein
MKNCARLPLLFSLFLLMPTLLLSACGGGESNVDQGNRDGTFHWGNGTEPQSLDPHIATGVPEHNIITALMEGLVAKDSKTLAPKLGC